MKISYNKSNENLLMVDYLYASSGELPFNVPFQLFNVQHQQPQC